MVDCNTTYYVSDWGANKVNMLDHNYTFIKSVGFSSPANILTVSNNVFIVGDRNVYKTDKYLNLLKQYTGGSTVWYRGIYYNSTESLLYLAPQQLMVLNVFDLNL